VAQDSGFHTRDYDRYRQLRIPTSQGASFGEVERIRVDSHPSTIVQVRPVIESADLHEPTFGRIAELAPIVSVSVMNSFELFGTFNKFAVPSNRGGFIKCAERQFSSPDTFWTIDSPGQFTCKTCFNRRQACMGIFCGHLWIILPLPPWVRDLGPAWQYQGCYIYQQEGNNVQCPGTWRTDKDIMKKKATIELQTRQCSEWVSARRYAINNSSSWACFGLLWHS
jgi:hypothetical protein